eukprot:scaffold1727_cov119-Isochrysis_galbana.AAC.6
MWGQLGPTIQFILPHRSAGPAAVSVVQGEHNPRNCKHKHAERRGLQPGACFCAASCACALFFFMLSVLLLVLSSAGSASVAVACVFVPSHMHQRKRSKQSRVEEVHGGRSLANLSQNLCFLLLTSTPTTLGASRRRADPYHPGAGTLVQ